MQLLVMLKNETPKHKITFWTKIPSLKRTPLIQTRIVQRLLVTINETMNKPNKHLTILLSIVKKVRKKIKIKINIPPKVQR